MSELPNFHARKFIHFPPPEKNIPSVAKTPGILFRLYAPAHEVVPRAVTMAVNTVAIICAMNLMVSFLLIIPSFFGRYAHVKRRGVFITPFSTHPRAMPRHTS